MTGTIPAMRMIRTAIAGILLLLAASASAQQFPTVPSQSVIGRLGVPGTSGPSQAIPFATLLANMAGAQSANKVYAGPASGAVAIPTFRLLVGADLPQPAASTLGGVKSLTCSASNWFNTLSTAGAFGCSQPSFADLTSQATLAQLPTLGANTALCSIAGGTPIACSKTQLTTLVNTATASFSGALPAFPNTTTSFLRGDGSYQTLNCAALSGVGSGCAAAAGQLPGEPSTGSATAGNVGEYIESVIASGSATSLTTNTAKTITSISLTAGDWDVTCSVDFIPAATTSATDLIASVSLATNTLDLTLGRFSAQHFPAVVTGGANFAVPVMTVRLSLASTTSVFMVGQATFTASTMTGYGIIRARRAR